MECLALFILLIDMFETRKKNIANVRSADFSFRLSSGFLNDVAANFPEKLNLIYHANERSREWLEILNLKIIEWKEIFLSTYARWAISISGLKLQADINSSPEFSKHIVAIESLRQSRSAPYDYERANVLHWTTKTAAENCNATINYLCEYGVVDLYATLEDSIFNLYKTFHFYNPQILLRNESYKKYRILYYNQVIDVRYREDWNTQWSSCLNEWHAKKSHEKLSKTFASFCNDLKYRPTTPVIILTPDEKRTNLAAFLKKSV